VIITARLLPVQNGHDSVGGAGVESSGRFIKKQDIWTGDEFHPYVRSLPLAAWYSADKLRTNLSHTSMKQVYRLNGSRRSAVDLHACGSASTNGHVRSPQPAHLGSSSTHCAHWNK